MKDVSDVTACVVDYGTFQSLADKLGETMKHVYYYSPFEAEYLDCAACVQGEGLPHAERVEDYLDPKFLKQVDLFVFPDRGYGAVQRHLRDDMGKAVWGSMGLCEIEEFRTVFVDLLKKYDMPLVQSLEIRGVTALAEHLKTVERKWVKIDRYRACMETWKHIDFPHSERELERLAKVFGPMKNYVTFIVQDEIEAEDGEPPVLEIGYDGWNIRGRYPSKSYQGYEGKNEIYLGHALDAAELPEAVQYVNEMMVPLLVKVGYQNFWSTEIRVKNGVPFFTDPTVRMPGQTGEQLLETCDNLDEVIWAGANGDLVAPQFTHEFAAEATLHFTGGSCKDWKTFRVPPDVSQWLKIYHACYIDGMVSVLPHEKSDEVGVMLGVGDTAEEAIEHLKENLELMKDEPVHADVRGFVDLLEKIEAAEEQGIQFSDQPLPSQEVAL